MNLAGQDGSRRRSDDGYAMAALLVSVAVMGVLMAVAMPVWKHEATREKEAELVFRGEQYARAIGLFMRKYPGTFPPNLDVLVDQKFLRKKYKDPMTKDGEFQLLYAAQVAGGRGPGQGGAPTATPRPPSACPARAVPPGRPKGDAASPWGRTRHKGARPACEVASSESSASRRMRRSCCTRAAPTTTSGSSSTRR